MTQQITTVATVVPVVTEEGLQRQLRKVGERESDLVQLAAADPVRRAHNPEVPPRRAAAKDGLAGPPAGRAVGDPGGAGDPHVGAPGVMGQGSV